MTILLSLIFGVALFCSVVVSLNLYTRRVSLLRQTRAAAADCVESLAGADEPVLPPDGVVAFTCRDIRLPGLPELFVHKPFDTASPLPRPALEPVPAPLEYKVSAV